MDRDIEHLCDFTIEQAVSVIKMLLFPEQVLKIYFASLNQDTLN